MDLFNKTVVLLIFVNLFKQGHLFKCARKTANACTITDINQTTPITFTITEYTNSLQILNFENSSMNYFPTGIFMHCVNLKSVNISNCGINKFNKNSFYYGTNLNIIDFSKNNITTLENSLFVGAYNLKSIDLSDNQIELIENNTFLTLANLLYLDLSNNKIKMLNEQILAPLKTIKYLYLNENQMENVDNTFINNVWLIELDLSYNNLTVIETRSLQLYKSLKRFDVSYNNINIVVLHNNNTIINNNHLKKLMIKMNVFSVEAANNNLSNVFVEDPKKMQKFLLANNSITNISFITDMYNLIELDLSLNLIELKLESFSLLEKLEVIKLRSCGISSLTFGTFSHQKNLRILDISYNNLMNINFHIFTSNNLITELDIAGNNLTEISIDEFKVVFRKINVIELTDNNWNCTFLAKLMNNLPDIKFITEKKIQVRNATNIGGVSCMLKNGTEYHFEENLPSSSMSNNFTEEKLLEEINSLKNMYEQVKMNATLFANNLDILLNNHHKTINQTANHTSETNLKSTNIILLLLLFTIICFIIVKVILFYINKKRIYARRPNIINIIDEAM